jgi:hypothetical protein
MLRQLWRARVHRDGAQEKRRSGSVEPVRAISPRNRGRVVKEGILTNGVYPVRSPRGGIASRRHIPCCRFLRAFASALAWPRTLVWWVDIAGNPRMLSVSSVLARRSPLHSRSQGRYSASQNFVIGRSKPACDMGRWNVGPFPSTIQRSHRRSDHPGTRRRDQIIEFRFASRTCNRGQIKD